MLQVTSSDGTIDALSGITPMDFSQLGALS
jgi:hypothetical protein